MRRPTPPLPSDLESGTSSTYSASMMGSQAHSRRAAKPKTPSFRTSVLPQDKARARQNRFSRMLQHDEMLLDGARNTTERVLRRPVGLMSSMNSLQFSERQPCRHLHLCSEPLAKTLTRFRKPCTGESGPYGRCWASLDRPAKGSAGG